MTSAGNEDDEWSKRLALTGQWKTPPTPMYAAGSSTTAATLATNLAVDPLSRTRTTQGSHDTAPAPSNSCVVDYTAALQEAYLRGAQAAAALAAVNNSSSTETPQQAAVLLLPAVPNPLRCLSQGESTNVPPPNLSGVERHEPTTAGVFVADHNTKLIPTSAAPFPRVTPISIPDSLPPALPLVSSTVSAISQTAFPLPTQLHPVTRNQDISLPPPRPVLSYPPRAMSMPNMGFDIEEEKRQKRLARNRASARLRRMRKKNLVEAYEVEVGILEKTLDALKKHQWGLQDGPGPLIEALSLDRGQQHLTVEERRHAAKDILDQQLQFVGMLENCMREQYVLIQLSQEKGELGDLKDALHLSPEQCTRIADSASGWEEDWCALQTVKSSLEAMGNNSWLLNENGNTVVEGFLSILHKTQISKLLLWCDHNIDSIDDLDYMNASFDPNPSSSPVFQFGTNNNPDCLLESSSAKFE